MAILPKPFTPPTERAAEELAKTAGSLTSVANGRITRVGVQVGWDISTPWAGQELRHWNQRVSTWSKSIVVSFYHMPGTHHTAAFVLNLALPLSPEDIAMSADTHMMLLNLARKEK